MPLRAGRHGVSNRAPDASLAPAASARQPAAKRAPALRSIRGALRRQPATRLDQPRPVASPGTGREPPLTEYRPGGPLGATWRRRGHEAQGRDGAPWSRHLPRDGPARSRRAAPAATTTTARVVARDARASSWGRGRRRSCAPQGLAARLPGEYQRRRRRRTAQPTRPRPASISAWVSGSGTAGSATLLKFGGVSPAKSNARAES